MSGERVDPEMMAYTFSEHVRDTETAPQEYLKRFTDELFVLEPDLKGRFCDLLLTELKEEITRRENPAYSLATVRLIEDIEQDWRNQQ